MPHQWTVLEAKMMRGHGIGINDLVFTVDDENGTGKARQDFFGFVIGAPQSLLCLFAALSLCCRSLRGERDAVSYGKKWSLHFTYPSAAHCGVSPQPLPVGGSK